MQYPPFTHIASWAISLAIGLTTPAVSMADDDSLETIVVTGSRTASANNLPVKRTVLERAEIERRNTASVLELLRGIDGVHVSQYGGRGGITSVFLQGAEPNFTVVLIDGVKVNDPNNSRGGSFNFANLNTAEIERIEVVRGPYSSIYGSDALSGVINIVTRIAPGERPLLISAEVGEEGLFRTSASYAAELSDTTNLAATVHSAREGEIVDGNDYENVGASLRLRGTGQLSYDLSARWLDSESEAFPEDSGGPQLAVLRAVDEREYQQASLAARLAYQLNDNTSVHLLASYLDQEEQQLSPGIAPGVLDPIPSTTSDAELSRYNITLHAVTELSDTLTLIGGLDFQNEDGEQVGAVEFFPGFSLPTDFELDRDILGVFTELQWDATDNISLSASVRNDDPDEIGSETTYKAGAQWAADDLRVYATWGEAFKLPSFFALGHALVGNPNLQPELSEGWTVGVDHTFSDRFQIGASVFQNEYEDLIDFDFQLFTNVNRNRVETEGYEAYVQVQQEQFTLRAHLTYVDIDAEDATLRQRPDWRGGLNLSWSPSEALQLGANWLWVDDSFDSSIPSGPTTLDGYNRIDLHATWQATQALTAWIAIDNAANEDYAESVGFPGADTRARAGVRFAF